MIKLLRTLFTQHTQENGGAQPLDLRLAAAALLVETSRADFTEDAVELTKLAQLLTTSLKLEPDVVDELVISAQQRVEEATSLYEFTQIINAHCDAGQKLQLIRAMWLVAYADGNVDKYEEHLIRQVADLTFVTHSDYIQCKLTARS